MATRFYLPSSGTSPVTTLSQHSGWFTNVAPANKFPTYTTKQGTALTNFVSQSLTAGTAFEVCQFQYISPPMQAITISGNRTGVIRCLESAAGVDVFWSVIIYVITRNGSSIRGTLVDDSLAAFNDIEWATSAATRKTASVAFTSSVVCSDGDRVVIEFGPGTAVGHASTGTGTMRVGDAAATDFALTTGLTTDLNPWIEFSDTITFLPEGSNGLMMMGMGT